MKKGQLPDGFQDFMPDECYNKNLIENQLSSLFSSYGFDKVETTTVEYYDAYSDVIDSSNRARLFKMTDADGNLIVLRPDTTLQIARIAANKFNNSAVNKLFYVSNSFEYLTDNTTARSREFAQAGVEMLGDSGISGDTECIILAIESLKAVGLDDFILEIGHAGFFSSLFKEAGLSNEDSNELRRLINKKDLLGEDIFLKNKHLSQRFIDNFLMLPSLFGDVSVLNKAEKMCGNDVGKNILNDLRTIMTSLQELGYDKYVSIDLGILRGDYYSGIILRGITKKLGLSVLDGGRYDYLGDSFGKHMPAIGFAIGIKRILMALDNQGNLQTKKACDVAYVCLNSGSRLEKDIVDKLRNIGKKVIKQYFDNRSELINYCKLNEIKTALVIKKESFEEINENEINSFNELD